MRSVFDGGAGLIKGGMEERSIERGVRLRGSDMVGEWVAMASMREVDLGEG